MLCLVAPRERDSNVQGERSIYSAYGLNYALRPTDILFISGTHKICDFVRPSLRLQGVYIRSPSLPPSDTNTAPSGGLGGKLGEYSITSPNFVTVTNRAFFTICNRIICV